MYFVYFLHALAVPSLANLYIMVHVYRHCVYMPSTNPRGKPPQPSALSGTPIIKLYPNQAQKAEATMLSQALRL